MINKIIHSYKERCKSHGKLDTNLSIIGLIVAKSPLWLLAIQVIAILLSGDIENIGMLGKIFGMVGLCIGMFYAIAHLASKLPENDKSKIIINLVSVAAIIIWASLLSKILSN